MTRVIALGSNGAPVRAPVLSEARQAHMQRQGTLRRMVDQMGILGAPIYGTWYLYTGNGRDEAHPVVPAAAIALPLVGAVLGYRRREDAVGVGAGAAIGAVAAGTALGVVLRILPRT